MSDDVTTNDKAFLKISKELVRTQELHKRAYLLLCHLDGEQHLFRNIQRATRKQPGPYLPLDFSQEDDPTILLFAPAFEIINERFDELSDHVERLGAKIDQLKELAEAYFRGEDVVMAKLAMDGDA